MQKCAEILQFLDALAHGGVAFVVEDHWDADLRAIGVAKPNDKSRLAYVAWSEDSYFVELEDRPSGAGIPQSRKDHADLSLIEALAIVRAHLSA
jgi:hypothetical protein